MTNAERFKQLSQKQNVMRQKTLEIVESDPTFPIKISGETYKLEYSYGPVTRIFKQTGLNVNLTAIETRHIGDPEIFEPLLREGLRKHHPETANDPNLMDNVSMRHLSYYTACIQLALTATEPDPEEIGRLLDEIEEASDRQQELPLEIGRTSAGSGGSASPVEFDPQK